MGILGYFEGVLATLRVLGGFEKQGYLSAIKTKSQLVGGCGGRKRGGGGSKGIADLGLRNEKGLINQYVRPARKVAGTN